MANFSSYLRNSLSIMAVIFSNRQLQVTWLLAAVAGSIALWIIHWLISNSFEP
ncbi:hypothetical protein [Arsenophonus endosymbiont of Aleurodicus floccissimus]|uniref:hypothetical protein n=1 Tax=Arsenophonus endosymbiont of Aleurodicus floccissimus TaxID=2152761 RepID=UPI0016029E37|nr:hypothetical protein [Arsenophonus endosymbiont of Aleurodicus floccissimus]